MPLGVGISSKPCLPFYIFSGDLLFDALIMGFRWICLIIGQTLGKGQIKKMSFSVSMET